MNADYPIQVSRKNNGAQPSERGLQLGLLQFAKLKSAVIVEANKDRVVTGGIQKAVLLQLDTFCRGKEGYPSLETIAECSCFDRRTVVRALAALEAQDIISIRRQGKSNRYRINFETLKSFAPTSSVYDAPGALDVAETSAPRTNNGALGSGNGARGAPKSQGSEIESPPPPTPLCAFGIC